MPDVVGVDFVTVDEFEHKRRQADDDHNDEPDTLHENLPLLTLASHVQL
jgi:hypothetical protein